MYIASTEDLFEMFCTFWATPSLSDFSLKRISKNKITQPLTVLKDWYTYVLMFTASTGENSL